MQIPPNDKPTELSYIDLLAGLRKDVQSDAIPQEMKDAAEKHIRALMDLLEGVSA